MVHYRSSAGPAEEVRGRVEALGRRCILASADLGDPDQVAGLAAVADAEFGRLDLLVNSAASFHSTHILDTDAEEWSSVLDVNVRGPHLLLRALAPLLRRSRGNVVNIADHMGVKPWVRYGAHSVSKAALIHLSRIQARAMAPDVRVNAVAPGLVLPPQGLTGEALRHPRGRGGGRSLPVAGVVRDGTAAGSGRRRNDPRVGAAERWRSSRRREGPGP